MLFPHKHFGEVLNKIQECTGIQRPESLKNALNYTYVGFSRTSDNVSVFE